MIHPLGEARGLNLGLKDAAALVDVIATAGKADLDIGAASSAQALYALAAGGRGGDSCCDGGVCAGVLRALAGSAGCGGGHVTGGVRARGAQALARGGRRIWASCQA